MNKKVSYCENCRKESSFYVHPVRCEKIWKNEVYTYERKAATCQTCGTELYVPMLEDENMDRLYDVIRKEKHLISRKHILEIPKKYAIGKRPLSLLLGWGELTLTRYCEGDLPTKQYSDILLRIYDDPSYYESVLEQNKDKISDVAYRKSKSAILKLNQEIVQQHEKLHAVLSYVLRRCGDITPLSLQKALYYIQGFYYAFHHAFLFVEDCQAWVHGPVYRDIYDQYRNNYIDVIHCKSGLKEPVFSEEELIVMDSVIHYLCCYSGKVLEQFTHKETPWLQTRGDLPTMTACDRVIDKACIASFFTDIREHYKMIEPQDIQSYASAMFQQIQKEIS